MNPGLRQLLDRSIIFPLQRKGARLLTKAALFVLSAFAFLIAILFSMAAFFIWLVQVAGAIIASLAVAGLFFTMAIVAILFALYSGREQKPATAKVKEPLRPAAAPSQSAPPDARGAEDAERAERITEAVVPILEVLQALGWKREELALLASAELAKKLPPLTLVGLALICGFLIGRVHTLPFGSANKKEAE